MSNHLLEASLHCSFVRVFSFENFTNHYRPQTKLRKGNVFTSVCQDLCSRGGILAYTGQGVSDQGVSAQGECLPSAGIYPGGFCPGGYHQDQRQTHTPPRHPLQRTVRILLECILVSYLFTGGERWSSQSLYVPYPATFRL